MFSVLEPSLRPLLEGSRPVPHSIEWLAQAVRYIQVFLVVCNMVVSTSSGSTQQLRSVMPFLNWLGMSRSDLSEGEFVYFAAFYAACAWTALLAIVFTVARLQKMGS